MIRVSLAVSLRVCVAAGSAAVGLFAQCQTEWAPGGTLPGTDFRVFASTLWDPDGAGPLAPRLVIGGDFYAVGDAVCSKIAVQDPVTGSWSPLGNGLNDSVYALVGMPNGDLIAGGRFTNADGTFFSNGIARWNGTSWGSLGAGIYPLGPTAPAVVYALTALPGGDVAVGGQFGVTGTVTHSIARWNGSSWSAFGSGVAWGNSVYALTTMPNGDLVAGGLFSPASGAPGSNIARWNGAGWSALGAGVNGDVRALAALPNGDVVAGGSFTQAGGAPARCIARWNGTSWSPLGSGTALGPYDGPVLALAVEPSGVLFAGGGFDTAGGVFARGVARWNGTAWQGLGTGIPITPSGERVSTLLRLTGGSLLVGGAFDAAGSLTNLGGLARWNGSAWGSFGSGLDGRVLVVRALADGRLLLGGEFQRIGGVVVNRVARFDGTSYVALGGGLNGAVWQLAEMPNGDLVVAGSFTTAGGVAAVGLARWNGATWSGFGAGPTTLFGGVARITSLAALPNGDLVVGGRFNGIGGIAAEHVARWNGTAWAPLGAGVSGPVPFLTQVNALAVAANGDLLAAGNFTAAGAVPALCVARWNGAVWSSLGAGPSGTTVDAYALHLRPNGDLAVSAAAPAPVGFHVASWNGATWSVLGSPLGPDRRVLAFATLPNGDLAAGTLPPVTGSAAAGVARWNGSAWTPLGPGVQYGVYSLAMLPAGELAAGGNYFLASGSTMASAYLGRLRSTCPASTGVLGTGCTGSGGPNVLTAQSLPWLGTAFRATATGMPASGLALAITSLSPATIPLAAVLPVGGAGCDGLLSVLLSELLVPAAGVAEAQLVLPDAPILIGATVYQYVAGLEFAPAGLVALTGTNRLSLTFGRF